MDEVFFLDEESRERFLGALGQALGCTYLCLWSYYPYPSIQLFSSIHGWFNDNTAQQPSSPSSHQINQALVRTLFDAYRQMLQTIENGCVPGHAFKEGVPYLELKEVELLNRALSDIQRKFYQEARIKKAVFMGCKSGEIEIGISNLSQQINMEMELRNWFPAEAQFSQQHSINRTEFPHGIIDQSWNVSSSYSSPLQSLSVGSSPEYSSLHMLNTPPPIQSSPFEFPKESPPIMPNSILLVPPPNNQLQLQAYPNNNNPASFKDKIRFPNKENDDAAMTRAMLAVISSASSSSCQSHINRNYGTGHGLSHNLGAFRKYLPGLSRNIRMKRNSQGQDMMKRAIVFYRNMHLRRKIENQTAQLGSRPNTSQLHHKMSERRRREKLNESFESLRSLLPTSSKKDKASLLSNTRDYLGTLKTEICELKQKCRMLETRLAEPAARRSSLLETGVSSSSNRNVEISITETSQPTTLAPEEREINLQVSVRGDYCNNIMNLVIRILEFINQVEHISLVNMEAAGTQPHPPSSFHRAIFQLRIRGNEFDKSTFQEAIQRIIDDIAR